MQEEEQGWSESTIYVIDHIKCVLKLSRTVAGAESCPASGEELSCGGEAGRAGGAEPAPCLREASQRAPRGELRLATGSTLHGAFPSACPEALE